jgi:lipoprotein NlpD
MAHATALRYRRHGLVALVALVLAACSAAYRWEEPRSDQHVVKKGDTLYSIAFRYGKNPDDIARWNRLGDGSLIYPGQVLRLTPSAGTDSTATASNRRAEAKPLPKLPDQPAPAWVWPTRGRIDVGFGGKPGPGTGILINGEVGQPIAAAASGRVVYAGSGLIGYGQLIIIKHNESYLSAYGYTQSLLVREGQTINQGQRIATMGEGPERKPRLHFEIRRNGEPVDPGQFLPTR